ncbi:hypothetical protein GGE12_000339 [Rhizobium mongolense]|uniref:Uncharacterized protein n=1 Tax=Rhizobium mongolense TaxID=57676 RepID=A0A7W6RHW6_9HYPH|nr:hypothetical protein [Rhizobium mongolense]
MLLTRSNPHAATKMLHQTAPWTRNHSATKPYTSGGPTGTNDRTNARKPSSSAPDAKLHFFEAGHFALEENLNEIAALISEFLTSFREAGNDSIRRYRPAISKINIRDVGGLLKF